MFTWMISVSSRKKPLRHNYTPVMRRMIYMHILAATPPSRFEPAPTPWRGILLYSVALVTITLLLSQAWQ